MINSVVLFWALQFWAKLETSQLYKMLVNIVHYLFWDLQLATGEYWISAFSILTLHPQKTPTKKQQPKNKVHTQTHTHTHTHTHTLSGKWFMFLWLYKNVVCFDVNCAAVCSTAGLSDCETWSLVELENQNIDFSYVSIFVSDTSVHVFVTIFRILYWIWLI